MSSTREGKIIRTLCWTPDGLIFLADHFTKQKQQMFQATIAATKDGTLTNTPCLGDIISNTIILSSKYQGT